MILWYVSPVIINELETSVVPSTATIRTDAKRGGKKVPSLVRELFRNRFSWWIIIWIISRLSKYVTDFQRAGYANVALCESANICGSNNVLISYGTVKFATRERAIHLQTRDICKWSHHLKSKLDRRIDFTIIQTYYGARLAYFNEVKIYLWFLPLFSANFSFFNFQLSIFNQNIIIEMNPHFP